MDHVGFIREKKLEDEGVDRAAVLHKDQGSPIRLTRSNLYFRTHSNRLVAGGSMVSGPECMQNEQL